jgi:hypothetical protein
MFPAGYYFSKNQQETLKGHFNLALLQRFPPKKWHLPFPSPADCRNSEIIHFFAENACSDAGFRH